MAIGGGAYFFVKKVKMKFYTSMEFVTVKNAVGLDYLYIKKTLCRMWVWEKVARVAISALSFIRIPFVPILKTYL